MRLNRRQLRRLIESSIYEQAATNPADDKKKPVNAAQAQDKKEADEKRDVLLLGKFVKELKDYRRTGGSMTALRTADTMVKGLDKVRRNQLGYLFLKAKNGKVQLGRAGNYVDLGRYESLGELINKVIGYDNLTSGRCPNIEALYKENV